MPPSDESLTTATGPSVTNAKATVKMHQLLDEAIAEAAMRGWHGKIELTLSVEDGILQENSVVIDTVRRRRIRAKK